jgi:hypothetical protein
MVVILNRFTTFRSRRQLNAAHLTRFMTDIITHFIATRRRCVRVMMSKMGVFISRIVRR